MKVKSQLIITSRRSIDFGEIVDYTDFTHFKGEVESHRMSLAWVAFAKWCSKNKVDANDYEFCLMERKN